MNDDLTKLPGDLPKPSNDGSCDHLLGNTVSNIILPTTKGGLLDIGDIDSHFVILYFFPMMSIPGKRLPLGWNDIPGARGCTPQNISISEHKPDFLKYDAMPIGVSTQPMDELSELSSMRRLSQVIISDNNLKFKEVLKIPTFQVEGKTAYKRVTLILKKSKIIRVFYPVFPPDKHIFEILEWLKNNSSKY